MDREVQYDNSQYSRELAKRIFLDDLGECIQFPKYIQIGTVNYCNARCKMCAYSTKTVAEKSSMKEELFDKIIAEMEPYSQWIESVALYWYGEPLLDIMLKDRIEKLKEIGIKTIQISTNGACLSKERVSDLFEAGLNDLRFSIDSINKETYEKIRGLNYEEVMRNILEAFKIRNERYPDIPIRIRLTEMEENMQEIDSFKEYWQGIIERGGDKVQIIPLHTKKNWNNGAEVKSGIDNYPCISLFSTMIIDVDGSVPVCCLDTDKEIVIGNVTTETMKEIWQSKLMHDIRLKHLEVGREGISICKGCIAWDRMFK